jgi:two-component system response regulator YesN
VFEFYPPLRRTRELVKERFGEPISLADAAKVAGLERKYFSTYFSAKVGISFRSWLSSIRVQEAIELIQSEDDNLTNIGARVGFQDMRTFERNFKRFTGRTPSDVKRQLAPQPPKKVRLSAEAQ